jgi:hypothetical protein
LIFLISTARSWEVMTSTKHDKVRGDAYPTFNSLAAINRSDTIETPKNK